MGRGGELDVDLELVLESRERAQERLGVRRQLDVDVDRRLAPAEEDRCGSAREVARSVGVGGQSELA
ncbi:MAG: hypothetical protein ACR2G9_06240 [Gaiellaceae bacterium]